MRFYTDAIQRAAQNSNGGSSTITEVDYNAHIGVRDNKPYNLNYANCRVDEFKYYYRVLNSAGECNVKATALVTIRIYGR